MGVLFIFLSNFLKFEIAMKLSILIHEIQEKLKILAGYISRPYILRPWILTYRLKAPNRVCRPSLSLIIEWKKSQPLFFIFIKEEEMAIMLFFSWKIYSWRTFSNTIDDFLDTQKGTFSLS